MDKRTGSIGAPVVAKYKFSGQKSRLIYGTISSLDDNSWVTVEVASYKEGKQIESQFLVCRRYNVQICEPAEVKFYNDQIRAVA
jgi:hypothetical protein